MKNDVVRHVKPDEIAVPGGHPLYNQKYYVTQDGHAITQPMTAADIVGKFGPIRELEANGFKVVPA
jgi:hypothetical protein